MDNKALYVLAGYDEASEARLVALQYRLYERGFGGLQTRDIPQHITMGSYPVDTEAELCARLRLLSREAAAFDVNISHIGIFPGAGVLFAAPDANAGLLALREHFSDSRDEFVWTPHTTILIDSPEVIYRALPVVMEAFSPLSGRVTALHLYEFFPAQHILSVPLAGQLRG